jgi:transketolase
LRYLVKHPQPSYLRLGKSGEKVLHAKIPDLRLGIWNCISDSDKSSGEIFLTTGNGLQIAHSLLEDGGILDYNLYSLPLWSMGSKIMQANQVLNCVVVNTIEDHLIDGGLSSWMLESLIDHPNLITKIRPKALNPKICNAVASQNELHRLGGF